MAEVERTDSNDAVQQEIKGIVVSCSDGQLLKGVKLSLNHTVEKLKEGFKLSIFARCFPTFAIRHEKTLQEIRVKTLEPLVEALYSDLLDLTMENLANPLNKLNSIIKKKKLPQNAVVWRPTGDPDKDMIAHDLKVLMYEKNRLLESLEMHTSRRQKLLDVVKAGRLQCHKNHMQIQLDELQMEKLQPLQALCKKLTNEELEKEIEKIYLE